MVYREDIALMAHLMRRAGFGAPRAELERLAKQDYEETVEDLLHPERQPEVDEYLLYRYHPYIQQTGASAGPAQANWLYHMVNTQRPLQEKMALFWHHLFATAGSKVDNTYHMYEQVRMLRQHCMGNLRDLLVELAKNPAMIFWLDNNENHKRAPNENWGRELLELFSMGVGNYTEHDVYECSRAFTGWTITAKLPRFPYGRFPWHFIFRPEDHDFTTKSFLGHSGRFNGEDVVDLILRQPACARFIARHLYNFFVADEPQVPAWNMEPPADPEAVLLLAETLVKADHQIKPVLHTLFNSDFFKEAAFKKVRSPVEVVVGTLRMTGDLQGPDPRLLDISREPGYMGHDLLEPSSVEGWHTGREWIYSGALVKRVNFVAERVSNTDLPGVQDIVHRVASNGGPISPEELVDRCLDLMGPLQVSEATKGELITHVQGGGLLSDDAKEDHDALSKRVAQVLALIAATREYQFG